MSCCPPVVPAMNTLWFCFDKATRRALHGTPPDVERKFAALAGCGLVDRGMEMFLMPSRLATSPDFTSGFQAAFSRLEFRTVHIGETEADFLDAPGTKDDLARLFEVLSALDAPALVIHAHHLARNTVRRGELLSAMLPGVRILVENNGFDNPAGAEPATLEAIFTACPEFGFCLDVTHVKDFAHLRLEDFITGGLGERIREVHWACSTHRMAYDPYEPKGYPGYGPYHALFSLTDVEPSAETLALVRKYPVVMEGVVPAEDTECRFLHQEQQTLQHGADHDLRYCGDRIQPRRRA